MIPFKPFYMIRHGESQANKGEYASGNMDVALTDLGRQQAEDARLVIEALPVKPVRIIHSHLSRARDTASIINTNLNLPMHETADFGEQCFGEWEGTPWTTFRPQIHAGKNPPGGETHDQFHARVQRALNDTLEDDTLPLIACHGGVFRAFGALYGEIIHGIENCKLYHFTPVPEQDFPWIMTPVQSPETPQTLASSA